MNYQYNRNYDTFCFQNCINYILIENGVRYNEFYINKSMSLIIEKNSDFELTYRLDKNCYDVLPEYSDNVRDYFSEFNTYETFIRNIASLSNDRSIIAGVDSFYLPYLPFYKKSHGLHSVIMTDYDREREEVHVVDWVEPWCYRGTVGLREFLMARSSANTYDEGMFSGIAVKNRWKEISHRQWSGELPDLITSGFALSLKQYYFPECNDTITIKGIYALRYIQETLVKAKKLSESNQEILYTEVHKIMYKFIHRKKFWIDFLEHIPKEYYNNDLSNIVNELSRQCNEWECFLYKFLVLKARGKLCREPGLSVQLGQLIDMEEKAGQLLLDYYIDCFDH